MKQAASKSNSALETSQLFAHERRPANFAPAFGPLGASEASPLTQLAAKINGSPRVQSLAQLSLDIHNSPRLFAGPAPARAAQRSAMPIQRIEIQGKKNKYYINDYHFIDRMHLVKKIGVSNTEHTVIMEEFEDFEGLAKAADKANGESFEFGGYDWFFKKSELVPESNDSTVDLSGEEIQALVSYITQDVQPNQAFKKDKNFQRAMKELAELGKRREKQQGKKEKEEKKEASDEELDYEEPKNKPPTFEEGEEVPIKFSIPLKLISAESAAMPQGVNFAWGQHRASCFLWGPKGSKEEHPHIHAFFAAGTESKVGKKEKKKKSGQKGEATSSQPKIIESAKATLKPTSQTKPQKRHWNFGADLKVQPNDNEGSAGDDKEVIAELEDVMQQVYIFGHSEGSEGKTAAKKEKTSSHNVPNNVLKAASSLNLGVSEVLQRLEELEFDLENLEQMDFETLKLLVTPEKEPETEKKELKKEKQDEEKKEESKEPEEDL